MEVSLHEGQGPTKPVSGKKNNLRMKVTLHEILPLHISVKVLKFLGPPLRFRKEESNLNILKGT